MLGEKKDTENKQISIFYQLVESLEKFQGATFCV